MSWRPVRGFCPMGCGETLGLANDGDVMCCSAGCPEPSAVSRILADPETEHVVRLDTDGYQVKHPLKERLNNELLTCTVHECVQNANVPGAGTYRAVPDPKHDGYYIWEKLS